MIMIMMMKKKNIMMIMIMSMMNMMIRMMRILTRKTSMIETKGATAHSNCTVAAFIIWCAFTCRNLECCDPTVLQREADQEHVPCARPKQRARTQDRHLSPCHL